MGWLSSFFSSDNSYSRKGQALSSTHDAFSIPTSSPTFITHPDMFNSESLHTPDLDTPMSSSSYTYPPQGAVYGSVPMVTGLTTRPGSSSLLPTHHDPHHTPLSPQAGYPPLSNTWNRLRAWLDREYPELGDTLNYGILPYDLAQLEMKFGFALPSAVRESYLCCDGQEAESAAGCSEGLFFGLKLLPLEDVLEEWRFWREVDDDPTTGANHRLRELMGSIPPGWVRKEYSQRGWIPLIADKAGNYVGVDLNPAESGSVGQVIVFGRDFDTKVVLWRGDGPAGWAKWLASFVDELESGESIEIGAGNEGSEDGEDDLGYESYFYDGTGRGQGDGGGDTGTSGLRMAGEYRGWNVLEALADRSLRRWHEAGVITDSPFIPPEETAETKRLDSLGNGVLETEVGSSAAVDVPVLADVKKRTPADNSVVGPVTKTSSRPAPLDLPTIPGTRMPAPRPVELPTEHDIIPSPSPPDSTESSFYSSFEVDLESGQARGMREVPRDNAKLIPARSQTLPSISPEDTIVVPVLSHSPPPIASHQEVPGPSSKIDLPDLFPDSTQIDPTSIALPSPISVHSEHPVFQLEAAAEAESNVPAEHDITGVEDELPSDTTIRLVGGGGSAGIVSAVVLEEEVHRTEDTDVASITSVTSESDIQKGRKTHKKTRSGLASLKKLGHLSGLRKRDSSNSIKVAVSPPPTVV